MKTASAVIPAEQRARVETAVAEAERQTSAEIVVVIATRSGSYDRAEDLFGMILGCAAVAGAWLLFQGIRPDESDWATGSTVSLGLVVVLGVFIAWTIAGAALATWVPALARPFVGRGHMEAEVRRRGLEAFHRFRIDRTGSRHGVLIFVSLLERMAWVAGDDAIGQAIPDGEWAAACATITQGFRRGDAGAALAEAVRACGERLAGRFPREVGDLEELPNAVQFMD